MQNYLYRFIFLFFYFSIRIIYGQEDAQISIYSSSPLAINPAMTGYFQNNNWRIVLNHRDKWSNLNELKKGFKSSNFSFDIPLHSSKLGIGILLNNNYYQKGWLNTFSGGLSFSYNVYLSSEKKQKLSFGIQPMIIQDKFNPYSLTWQDQYNIYDGTINQSTKERFELTSKNYIDFNFGILWHLINEKKKSQPWLGISCYHITEPKSNFNNKNKKTRKFILNTGSSITKFSKTIIIPTLMIVNQGNLTQYSTGSIFKRLNSEEKNFSSFGIGFSIKHNDAFVSMFIIEFDNFELIINYETTIFSSIKKHINRLGGFEITIKYTNKNKSIKNMKFN